MLGSIERTRRSDDLPDEVNEDAEQRGLLNPDWVETLMGFPIGWTRPDGPPLVEPLSMRGSRPESRLSGSGGGSD